MVGRWGMVVDRGVVDGGLGGVHWGSRGGGGGSLVSWSWGGLVSWSSRVGRLVLGVLGFTLISHISNVTLLEH